MQRIVILQNNQMGIQDMKPLEFLFLSKLHMHLF